MIVKSTEVQQVADATRTARIHATRQTGCAAQNELIAARTVMRDKFATQRGWIYSKRPFTVDQLRRGSTQAQRGDYDFQVWPMDHVEYFRLANHPWRPVAILSHEYGSFQHSQALARKLGIIATLLPNSWYSPGHANAVLYTGFNGLCP